MTGYPHYIDGRVAYGYGSDRKEGTVIDLWNEYGTDMLEVHFDGEEKPREVTAHYAEGLTDPFEWAKQVVHHGKADSVPERDWTVWDTAEEQVREGNQTMKRMGHDKTTQLRLVRRRKPGKVEVVG